MSMAEWRKCTTCKKSIPFGGKFYICNVTTCHRKRAGLIFCDVSCWDAHLPVLRHKEAWAIEKKALTEAEWSRVAAGELEDPTYPTRKKEAAPEPEKQPTSRVNAGPSVVLRRRSESSDS